MILINRSKQQRVTTTIGITIILLAVLLLVWYLIVVDNVVEEISVEAGSSVPVAQDFLFRDLPFGSSVSIITDISKYDLTKVGLYDVTLRYCGIICSSHIRVSDTRYPTAEIKDLTVFSYEKPNAADFVVSYFDANDCTATYVEEPDMTIEGTQTLLLSIVDQAGNRMDYRPSLTVIFDTKAPEILGVENLTHFVGTEIDLLSHIEVTDNYDPQPKITSSSNIKPETPGIYSIEYIAEDASGNRSTAVASVSVIKDSDPPLIYGAYPQNISVGATISYRKNVLVEDDYDSDPTLTVDSSSVNLSKPGTYPLIYRATDRSGNESVIETTVTVIPKSQEWVDEATIQKKVEEVAAEILEPDMTAEEQVRAIYRFVRYSHWYSGHSNKNDWKQAGYQLLASGQGDCFSFFGASKLLFEYCGIPNIDVHRKRLPIHNTDHIWNMVSIDGGKSYYYYDSTPLEKEPVQFLLLTDSELDWYSSWYFDYFSRDKSILPPTPTKSIR